MRRPISLVSPIILIVFILGLFVSEPANTQTVNLEPGYWNRDFPGIAGRAVLDGSSPGTCGGAGDIDQVYGAHVYYNPQPIGPFGRPFNYQMWYTGISRPDITINYAESDDGLNWRKLCTGSDGNIAKENPVMDWVGGGTFDNSGVGNPSLVDQVKTGSCACLWMYYEGQRLGRFVVGLATTKNGVDFLPDNPQGQIRPVDPVIENEPGQSWRSADVGNPTAILDGDTFKIWFVGYGNDGETAIGYAESKNGESFTVRSEPVLRRGGSADDNEVNEPHVIKVDGLYRMWYKGIDRNNIQRIMQATSTDGINWKKNSAQSSMVFPNAIYDTNGVGHPSVVRNGKGDYEMYFTASDPNDSQRIYYAINPKPTIDSFSIGSTTVSGRGTPGTDITIQVRENGQVLGTGRVPDNTNRWTVNLSTPVPGSGTIIAIVDGRTSDGGGATATTTPGAVITATPSKLIITGNVLIKAGAKGATPFAVLPSPTPTRRPAR